MDERQATGSDSDSDRTSTMAVVLIASFLAPFMLSALNVALPEIGKEFSLSAVALSWVVTANILSAAVFLMPAGRLADMRGRRKIFFYGMIIFTAGTLLAAIANSAAVLILARIVNGLGAAMLFSTGMAIIVSIVPPAEKGRALGWNVAAVYLGLSLGPVAGGLISHALGWRWIFVLATILGTAITLVMIRHLKAEPLDSSHARFDIVGSILFGIALASLLGGCSILPRVSGAALLAVGAASLIFFLRWELQCRAPIFNLAVFRTNPVFMYSNAAALINYAATAATSFLLSLYLEYVRGFSAKHTGLILIAQPLIMAVFSPLTGRLSDAVDPGKIASIGMAISAAGLLAFGFLGAQTPVWFIVAGLSVLGFGFALFSSPNTNAVLSSVSRHHLGAASSTLSTMRVTGQMASMAIVTLIEALVLGSTQLGPQNSHLYVHCLRISFLIFFVLCALGIFASAVRGKIPAAPAPENRRP